MTSHVETGDETPQEAREIELVREETRLRADRIRTAYEAVMSTEHGRVVMWDLIGRAGIFQATAAFGMTDKTFHNIGRQDYGKELYARLAADMPELFNKMALENVKWTS